jgi:hypothetical protein
LYEAKRNIFWTRVRLPPGPPLGDLMNILCGYHAQSADTCHWVINNYANSIGNITVELWVKACKEYLESINDGPALVSTR